MRLIMISEGLKTYRSTDELGWNFAPTSGAERMARFTKADMGKSKTYYNFGPVSIAPFEPPAPGTPPAPPTYDRKAEQLAAKPYDAITLGSGFVGPVRIETGSLEAPMGALQACADDLVKTWNLDPAKMSGNWSPAMPEGGGSGWLPQGTIPFPELFKLAGGANQVRLMLDAGGKATGCFIHWATLSAETNEKICAILMSKAKFVPAKDAEGQPIASFWIGSPQFLGPPMFGRRR
jgi:hypothetical protein